MVRGAPNQNPKFEDLVLKEVHAETGEQILRLLENVTSQQYREYMLRPDNVSLVNRINSVNFELGSLNFAEKNQLKELLVIAKLWIIQDSERNFIHIDETLEDMVSDRDNGLIDSNGEFRAGVLPLFQVFNISRDVQSFYNLDGEPLDIIGVSPRYITLDFNSDIISSVIRSVDEENQPVHVKMLKVQSIIDVNGTKHTASDDLFVRADCLRSDFKVEEFQSTINVGRVDIDYLKLTKDDRQLIANLGLVKDQYGISFCHTILNRAVRNKNCNLILQNLETVISVIGRNESFELIKRMFDVFQQEVKLFHLDSFSNVKICLSLFPTLLRVFPSSRRLVRKLFKTAYKNSLNYTFFLIRDIEFTSNLYGAGFERFYRRIVNKLMNTKHVGLLCNQSDFIVKLFGRRGFNMVESIESNFRERVITANSQNPKDFVYLLQNLNSIKDLPEFGIVFVKDILDYVDTRRYNYFLMSNFDLILEVYGEDKGYQTIESIVRLVKLQDIDLNVLENTTDPRIKDMFFRRIMNTRQYEFLVLIRNVSHYRRIFQDNIQELKTKVLRLFLQQESNSMLSNSRYVIENFSIRELESSLSKDEFNKVMSNISLHYIVSMNDDHDLSDDIRFEVLNELSVNTLYLIMIHGVQEMYTSTFNNGLFSVFISKLNESNISIYSFLENNDFRHFRIFIKLLVVFNKFSIFMNACNDTQRADVLSRTFDNIEDSSKPLDEFVTVAQIIEGNNLYIPIIEETLINNYLRVSRNNNEEAKLLYGLLIRLLVNTYSLTSQQTLEIAYNYKLENVGVLDVNSMFVPDPDNNRLINIQMHLFYDDDDAYASFAHFLSQYPAPVVETDQYVIIEMRKGNKVVRMFANKPSDDPESNIEATKEAIQDLPIHVVNHRGHSYHVDRSIEQLGPDSRLVFLGSCGGYDSIADVLDRSSSAQVIATQGTGTMMINDPLMYKINQMLLTEYVIGWGDTQRLLDSYFSKKKQVIRSRWKDYVLPHRNYSMMLLRAHNFYAEQIPDGVEDTF